MSQVRYLIDESLRLSVVAALRRIEPLIDVHRVGQPQMPPFASPATALLAFGEMSQRMRVTLDRSTMPAHVAEHQAAGGRTWGVLLVTHRCSFRQLLDDLVHFNDGYFHTGARERDEEPAQRTLYKVASWNPIPVRKRHALNDAEFDGSGVRDAGELGRVFPMIQPQSDQPDYPTTIQEYKHV